MTIGPVSQIAKIHRAEPLPTLHSPAPRTSRVLALDGLRAIAAFFVLLFHYGPSRFPGGFVGVDVFFVLSGYLITGILLKQLSETGTIKFFPFFRRRVARLAPALCTVVLGTIAFVQLLSLDPRGEIWRDIVWVLTYTSNWKRSFIERFGDSTFFNHTWSIGVEEQFYLTWFFVLAVSHRFFSRRGLLALTLGLAVAVTLWRWYLVLSCASSFRLYHGFDTRADELLIGCALAIALSMENYRTIICKPLQLYPLLPVLLLVLLPVIGILCPIDSAALPIIGYPIAAFGAAAIIVNCRYHPSAPLPRLLALPPFVYLGSISYGIYLWHVPVRMLVLTQLGFDLPQQFAAAALTVLLATASFLWVERWFVVRHTASNDPVKDGGRATQNGRKPPEGERFDSVTMVETTL